jgi:C4-dicarboxylate-specific signal transduction histidine kinase
VAIEIRDGGPGFPSEMLDGYYVPKRAGKALGLGLTIARRIVELHGGTLVFTNHQEGGAVATITLPAGTKSTKEEL